MRTATVTSERAETIGATSFWSTVGAALAALARRTGSSLRESPLPEIREVANELREWPSPTGNGPHER